MGQQKKAVISHCLALPMRLEWAVPVLRTAVWLEFINVVLSRREGKPQDCFWVERNLLLEKRKFRKEIAASREFLFRGKVKLAPEIALKSYWSFLG